MANRDFTMVLDEGDYAKVQRALSQLSVIEQDAVVQKGLQEGMSVIVREGRKILKNTLSRNPHNVRMRKYMASKRGGKGLENSFSTKVLKKKGKGYGGFGKAGHHAHLVDSGTVKRYTSKGYYRGSVSKGAPNTGSRFWRSAVETKKNQAMRELMESIELSINKIISRNR